MKLCSKCDRIVSAKSICDDAQCPIEGIQRSPQDDGVGAVDQEPEVTAVEVRDEVPAAVPAAAASAPSTGLRFCPTCGTGYPAGERFCMHDGTPLPAGAPTPVIEADEPSAPPATTEPEPEPVPEEPALPEPEVAAPEIVAVDLSKAPAEAPDSAPSEPVEVADPAPPTPVEPVVAQAAPEAAAEDLACPVCGLSFEPGVRFCDRDGARLIAKAEAEAAQANAVPLFTVQPEEEAWEDDWDEEEDPAPKRKYLVPALVGVAVLLAAGGGYAFWAGHLAPWLGPNAASDPAGAGGTEAEGAGEGPVVPGLMGNYTAHIADQDIALTITAERPQALVSAVAVVTYVNVVTGNTCTASLTPVSGGGVGGDTSNAVSFRQEPVADKPPCPRDIPVRMEIVSVPDGADGIVGSIEAEWLSPSSDEVLMSGTLLRETN